MGDMQHLMLLESTFADFLDCNLQLSPPQQLPQPAPGPEPGQRALPHCLHAYLAQCPIGTPSADRRGLQPGPLHALMADLDIPGPVRGLGVNQVNFWASPK